MLRCSNHGNLAWGTKQKAGMLDTMISTTSHQRARGAASVGLTVKNGRSVLRTLRQEGCAKAFLPHVLGDPEVVFLNTAGGLTGGDRLDYHVSLSSGVTATATTQTAERAYAATAEAGPARVQVAAEVGPGARLDWLPQETILYNRATLTRSTRITLAGDSEVLMCEALVLGRAAMGETLDQIDLFDRREITRDGVPVVIDAVALNDAVLRQWDNAAGLGGARAVATVALVASGAEDAAPALRRVGVPEAVSVGVSGWNGRSVVRLLANDGWPLRLALAAVLRHLRAHKGRDGALPRVWQI